MTARQQPWRDDEPPAGRLVVLSRNPIAEAIATIAGAVGLEVHVVAEDDGGRGESAVAALDLRAVDAVVLCDHDAPDAAAVLRLALASPARYVAMMASRGRAAAVETELSSEGVPLETLHLPAGLDTGGRAPGEIALSVVAEVVATAHRRSGRPLRELRS